MADRYTLTVGITEQQYPNIDRALGEWDSPMDAMASLAADDQRQRGYTWVWAECWRWEDGVRRERQWRIDVD